MENLHYIAKNFDPQLTTTFSIPFNTRIDADGFLAWVNMEQETLQHIKTLEISDDVLSKLYTLVVGNPVCQWNDLVRTVHRMTRLEDIEISRKLSSVDVFPVMLEDLLMLMSPSMLKFKRFCVARHVACGYLSVERLKVLKKNLPSSIEEFILPEVRFREPTLQGLNSDNNTVDLLGIILPQLTNLKRLTIGQPTRWGQTPPVLSLSNLRMIFRYPSLHHVTLRHMSLSDDDLVCIAEELVHNCTLETIELNGLNRNRSTRGFEKDSPGHGASILHQGDSIIHFRLALHARRRIEHSHRTM